MLVSEFLTEVDIVTSKTPFNVEEKLDLAHRELTGIIYPKLRQNNDGYFVQREEVTIKANQEYVNLPKRAFSASLVEIKLSVGDSLCNLTKVNPSQITSKSKGVPRWYYHIRNKIALWPIPQSDSKLIFWYEVRPSKLVDEMDGRAIASIIDNDLTIVPRPLEFESSLYDVVNIDTGDFQSFDVAATRSGNVYTSTAWGEDTKAGDYIFKAGETGIIPLPEAYIFALREFTAAILLRSLGDYNAAKDRRGIGMELLNGISDIITRTTEENEIFDNVWL